MKPLSWLSAKWAFIFFAATFESNQTWYMIKKIRLQYIVCAGKLGGMSCCLVQQQSNSCLCWWFPSLAFLWHIKSWTLYLCVGFDCDWCVRVSSHWQKQECHHQQDDHACLLLSISVILAITFWWLQYHCTTGLMWLHHNQKHSVC